MVYVMRFTCTVLLLSLGVAAAFDPCLPGNHKRLNEPERSTAVISSSGFRSDESLTAGWYAFTSPAGSSIPTVAPAPGACSAVYPIWNNGTDPIQDGKIHQLYLCYALSAFDSCGIQLKIKAKRCQKYTVYELKPTSEKKKGMVIRGAAYCAGSEARCQVGYHSKNGFTPGCYRAPTIQVSPLLTLVENADSFKFHCELQQPDSQLQYSVHWFADKDQLHSEELTSGQTSAWLPDSMLYINGQSALGRNLTCAVRGKFSNETADRWGIKKHSEPYFIGLEVTDSAGVALRLQNNTLILPENSDETLRVRSTVPLLCEEGIRTRRMSLCDVTIELQNDNSVDKSNPVRCRAEKNRVVEQLKLASCGITISADSWDRWIEVPVRATKDFKYDGLHNRQVAFEPSGQKNAGKSLWDGYQPQKIDVKTEDFVDRNVHCASSNDPHMRTFDGFKYNNYYEGEFILYRNKDLPFEVRAFYKRCNRFATCNCAVAVRAGDDVIIVDRCNSLGDVKIWGTDSTKGADYNVLRTRTISQDEVISPNFKIYTLSGGRRYEIYLPHGAKVRADLNSGSMAQFMNVWVYPSPADFNRTEGLCGSFDSQSNNDLLMRDGSLFTGAGSRANQQPKTFSKEWRASHDESIYNGNVPVNAFTYRQTYCTCTKLQNGQSSIELNCNDNTDTERLCDASGQDITEKNFEYRAAKKKSPGLKKEPFLFDPDWEAPEATWPTASGWTEARARQFCEDFIKKSRAFSVCANLTSIQDDVDMCVEDIKLSDSTDWALTALESFKDKCAQEFDKESQLLPPDAFCLNECNLHGDCLNLVCHCHVGYYGEDCSLTSELPSVLFAPLCDVSQMDCDEATIYGDGFLNEPGLQCQYEPVEVVGGAIKSLGEAQATSAGFESFAEVLCPVHSARGKRAAAATPGQFSVGVVNKPGQQARGVVIYTMYDSRCQSCNFSTAECFVKAGKCLIENQCYQSGDESPSLSQRFCDPESSQSSWTRKGGDALPTWAIAVIVLASVAVVMSAGAVTYLKCFRKRTKVVDQ